MADFSVPDVPEFNEFNVPDVADFNVPDVPDFNVHDFNVPDPNVPDPNVPDPDVDMNRSPTPRPPTPTFVNTASKRMRSPSSEPGPSASRAAKKARQLPSRRLVKGKAPADWHLKKGEIPADSGKTKVYTLLFSILLLLISFSWLLKFTFAHSGSYWTKMRLLPKLPMQTRCDTMIDSHLSPPSRHPFNRV